MLTVELIYDTDCPNVNDARKQLMRAFADAGISPQWLEWDRRAPESPARVHTYGSPTILVNGRDVAGASLSASGVSCRLYAKGGEPFQGVPSVEMITAVLLKAKGGEPPNPRTVVIQKRGWRNTLTVLPAVATALLPKLTCPACWPAYAGLLSSLGLGFVNYTPYLFPLTALFLILAVVLLGYRATSRRGFAPFMVGILAAITVIVGKFVFVSDGAMYGGIILLMVASLWNSWPQRGIDSGACSARVPAGPLIQQESADKT